MRQYRYKRRAAPPWRRGAPLCRTWPCTGLK